MKGNTVRKASLTHLLSSFIDSPESCAVNLGHVTTLVRRLKHRQH